MNKSQLFASPNPGLNLLSLYFIANSCFPGLIEHLNGFLEPALSVKEIKKASSHSEKE